MATPEPGFHPRRFAVIGAGGAAGLATLKIASEELQNHIKAGTCELVGFEQREDLGGVWLPDPNPSPLRQKWPDTPLYGSLITNVPHPIMYYPSYPAPPSTPLFTGARTVNKYLQAYAAHFRLRKYIHFNSRVTAAAWDQSINQWRLAYDVNGLANCSINVSYFDHLLITTGHRRDPFFPEVLGLDTWASSESRSYVHSIWYRNPEPYRGRRVLVIGGGRSGIDINDELAKFAKRTIHSSRSFIDRDFGNTAQRGPISHFSSDGFVQFINGNKENVDRVIFATGYQYNYDFLTQIPTHNPSNSSSQLYNSRFHIYPLALHMFPLQASFPPSSLALICATIGVTVFSLAEAQATLAIRQMSGRVSLDFSYELAEVLNQNERLRHKYDDSAVSVAQEWHRFNEETAYDYVDLIWRKALDSQRIPTWKREIMPQRYTMRAEWHDLERLGLSKAWVDGVGKDGIQEWIELMRRVVRRAQGRQHGIVSNSL
ncbi:hypothetical protein FRC12_010540 [Ceratobasidium sp. 428]|nr:hypothetical protein FRC12_010540 [Ceratobasidium sp. 428]